LPVQWLTISFSRVAMPKNVKVPALGVGLGCATLANSYPTPQFVNLQSVSFDVSDKPVV
jgi:hypothetical protein